MQDDFYLNLVDWSSHNVLAVGLGNCVYLWNACSSKVRFGDPGLGQQFNYLVFFLALIDICFVVAMVQVTKLCDLGVDDSVCSVGWAQRGTHLAVGTNQGKVQVMSRSFTSF